VWRPCLPAFCGHDPAPSGSLPPLHWGSPPPCLHRDHRPLCQGRPSSAAHGGQGLAGGTIMLMQAVDTYLAMRRAVGFALDHTEGYLRNFARFALARGDTHIVATTAVDWAARTTSEAQRHNRLHTVIRFARFMAAEDARHEIPPEGLFWGRRQRPMPYIFSDDEIAQLLSAASRLGPPGSLRPQTYSTLFGLLAVTGMRVSEARNLHLHDVTRDGLLVSLTMGSVDDNREHPVYSTGVTDRCSSDP